jgi:acyl-coenzyme A thioesterase PaaI-like protein
MGNAAHIAAGNKRSVTVNLDIKYISAGKLGDNLVGKVEVLKRTKTLVFINCKILNPNGIVATASGTWKILS